MTDDYRPFRPRIGDRVSRQHRIAILDELIGHCLDAGGRLDRMCDVAQRLEHEAAR
jgi:hypothetical protein